MSFTRISTYTFLGLTTALACGEHVLKNSLLQQELDSPPLSRASIQLRKTFEDAQKTLGIGPFPPLIFIHRPELTNSLVGRLSPIGSPYPYFFINAAILNENTIQEAEELLQYQLTFSSIKGPDITKITGIGSGALAFSYLHTSRMLPLKRALPWTMIIIAANCSLSIFITHMITFKNFRKNFIP